MVKTKWRRKINRLNLTYLACLKEAGWQGDTLATLWGVPEQVFRALEESDFESINAVATVGAPLFRIQADQMQSVLRAAAAGDDLRAKAALMVLVAGPGGEEQGSGSRAERLGDRY